jgi:hypothetical protein
LFRLGKYQLQDRLGPQGAVESYRAVMADGEPRAAGEVEFFVVKLLRADRVQRQAYPALAARFLAAARRLLNAPLARAGQLVEVDQATEGVFVVSRWVDGVDLVGLLQAAQQQAAPGGAGLAPAVVGVVGGQMARVLSAAHVGESPLFHLGLSPGNVLVTPTGEVVVRDFGLFASVRGLVDHPIEKWLFVAPELMGAAIGPDTLAGGVAADLYSLGALLHFLLLGRPRFEARTLAELSDHAWEPLRDLPGVPTALSAAIRALTTPDSEDRPQAASQVSEWLAPSVSAADAKPPVASEAARDDGGGDVSGDDGAVSLPSPRDPVASWFRPAISRGAVAAISRSRPPRPSWLVALVTVVALLLIAVFGLLTFRLARTFAAKRAAQGVAIAQRRAGETPAVEPQINLPARRRSPESQAPAVPTPLPEVGSVRAPDAGSPRSPDSDPIPVSPAGRFVMERSKTPPPKLVPNHLFVDSQPHGASVWIDGGWRGITPLDLPVGPGGKGLLLVAAGYRVFRDSFDARDGAIIRRALVPVTGPVRGDAFLKVVCRTAGKYPVFIDDVETGLICPADHVPVLAGVHSVGVFVPAEHKLVAVEITAPAGPKPVEVNLAR